MALSSSASSAVSLLRTPDGLVVVLRHGLAVATLGVVWDQSDTQLDAGRLHITGDFRFKGDPQFRSAGGHFADNLVGRNIHIFIARRTEADQRIEISHVVVIGTDLFKHRLGRRMERHGDMRHRLQPGILEVLDVRILGAGDEGRSRRDKPAWWPGRGRRRYRRRRPHRRDCCRAVRSPHRWRAAGSRQIAPCGPWRERRPWRSCSQIPIRPAANKARRWWKRKPARCRHRRRSRHGPAVRPNERTTTSDRPPRGMSFDMTIRPDWKEMGRPFNCEASVP